MCFSIQPIAMETYFEWFKVNRIRIALKMVLAFSKANMAAEPINSVIFISEKENAIDLNLLPASTSQPTKLAQANAR